MPFGAHAQEIMITFEPTFHAQHAGFSLYDGNPDDIFTPPPPITASSSKLTSVDGEWTITELREWFRDVPQSRGVYVLARIDPDTFALEGGVPVRGGNYDLAHVSFSASATSTHTLTLSMPFLGDAATPSGTYLFFAAELPETKSVYDEATGIETTSPYTDDDLAAWLAYHGSPNIFGPTSMTFEATFEYINDGPPPCTEDCFSNVLFLPGVKASRLYKAHPPGCVVNCEDQLWEPNTNSDVEDLFMNPDGTSVRSDIYTRDILDSHFSFGNGDVYGTFSKFMKSEVDAGIINAWSDVPYDWRLDPDDILEKGAQTGERISYLTATDTPYIIQELKRLAGTSKSGKVTIVAHSNGGLLTKALMNKLGETGEEDLVDKIIFVGVPQTGTPKAIAVLLHGYQEALLSGIIVKTSTARTLAENLPAAYNLLPSEKYFYDVATPPVEFSNEATTGDGFHAAYGGSINSYSKLRELLLGLEGRSKPAADNTDALNVLNYDLLTQAEALHADLDDWEPPDGVELYEIAGVGIETPGTIKYVDSCPFSCLTGDPHLVMKADPLLEGDGTVIVASAHAGTGTKYYFNIADYNRTHTQVNHASIMGAANIDSLIDKILRDDTSLLPSTITTIAPFFANTKHLVYRVHSPVSLDLYDSSSNHTGIATTTLPDGTVVSFVENNIPGTYYDQFGEVQYVFSDGSTPVNIVLDGQESGFATFDIDEMTGNVTVASTTFVNIPVQPQTLISMSMSAGGSISGASDLSIDTDGDGVTDTILPPGGVVMYEDFVADEEEVSGTPVPQPQPGGGGGGGNGPIVTITATATSTSTSTPEATRTPPAATSSPEIAATSSQMKQPTLAVKKIVAAASPKPLVIAERQDATANNVKLVAGVAASLAGTSSPANPAGERWWSRAYKIARNIIRFVIGL
mgnify:FL=1